MGIPESQLETWSHQGSITNSSNTYNTIKNILQDSGVPYAVKDYEVFLQGSYGNDTNIWSESDVDIVIKLNSCFHSDLSSLTDEEKAAWRQAHSDATYGYVEFKREVMQVLTDAYADDARGGDKAIAIASKGNRRKADVIVATEFRRYSKFRSTGDQLYASGICFWNKAGDRIANYPKQHSANLTSKHQVTGSWLKPMVRVLKNLRGRLVEDGQLKAGIAPSYYLEGLLYNVPADKFITSYEDCFVNAINWIRSEAEKDKLVCANEQYYLLRDNSHVCWSTADFEAFLSAAVKLWNSW
jgi:hypothetical protein